jgi:hypothetical protein
MQKNIFVAILVISLLLPYNLFAQIPSSTNYRLEDTQFDGGGDFSTSANYQTRGALDFNDNLQSTSSNYNAFPGYSLAAYPGVPAVPTLTNTGGNLYNQLDFTIGTGGNTSDTNYAIAISTDSFASTTNFVQADLTVGPNPVWQNYVAWGSGSTQRLVSLIYSTTYTIKVKARFGLDSESSYSLTAQAATVNPTLSITVAGLASGSTIGAITTNVGTTATSVAFSNLQTGSIKVAAQQVTVTTNAVAGYTVTLQQDHDLIKSNGTNIPPLTATNLSPAPWPTGITTARFGYHTNDATLCTGSGSRFSSDNTYASASTTPLEISCNTGPASSETTKIVFKVEVEALQATGDYRNQITYITTAQY